MTDACERVRQAVLVMPMAATLQLQFDHLAPGETVLRMPVLDAFCFRPGQLQATAVYAIADFAAVSAAGTLLPPGWVNATYASGQPTLKFDSRPRMLVSTDFCVDTWTLWKRTQRLRHRPSAVGGGTLTSSGHGSSSWHVSRTRRWPRWRWPTG